MKRRLQSHVQPVPEAHQSGAHSRAPRRTRGSPDQLPRCGLLARGAQNPTFLRVALNPAEGAMANFPQSRLRFTRALKTN
jgi:hypothetical protein